MRRRSATQASLDGLRARSRIEHIERAYEIFVAIGVRGGCTHRLRTVICRASVSVPGTVVDFRSGLRDLGSYRIVATTTGGSQECTIAVTSSS